jgi:ATP-dependent Clp protease ATP-binding subunit ClpB
MITKRIQTSRAALDNPSKPIGVFMLAGPSGVGKTETALALAETLYGGEQNVITINMSEFQEAHTVSTLKGAPPGYVGYGEGGILTEAVRRKPYSVVLLDEVEKAHPDVFGVLLQVLDDGRLTDGQGRTVDFRNAIVVMTSNLGSQLIQEMAGERLYEEMKKAVMEVVGQRFQPEFVNRLDEIIVFHPLQREQIEKIAEIQIDVLARRLADQGLRLVVTPAAVELLANAGYDPVYGARPLRRVVQTRLGNPLARRIVLGDFAPGQAIEADARDGALAFSVVESPAGPKAEGAARGPATEASA